MKILKNDLDQMLFTLKKWSEINSGSKNEEGLKRMAKEIETYFSSLKGEINWISLPPWREIHVDGTVQMQKTGDLFVMTKRPDAPFQILLGGHYDTVFSSHHSFQKTKVSKDRKFLIGPGVADMKGGLIILHKVLDLLEKQQDRHFIGWKVVLNPDEEMGSPSSTKFIKKLAKHVDLALFFEPSFQDGSCVKERKGSWTFSFLSYGKKAHAGRDFFSGKNAILPLTKAILELEKKTDPKKETTINVGVIHGGTQANVVPDFAFCKINIRFQEKSEKEKIEKIVHALKKKYKLSFLEHSLRPPKKMDTKAEKFFSFFSKLAKKNNLSIRWKNTGGVCDGNTTASLKIPTLDTLGVVGGNLHTDHEYMVIDSLQKRTCWVASALMTLALKKGKI